MMAHASQARQNAEAHCMSRDALQADVEKLQGRYKIEYTVAKLGAERLWKLLNEDAYVPALGALTGAQAVQMVQAGEWLFLH
jgi:isocitrate lyase